MWRQPPSAVPEAPQAFDLAGVTNTLGAPSLRSLQGRESGNPAPADPNQGKNGGDQNKVDSSKGGAQDKKLSATEVKNLEENTGQNAHEIKQDALGTNKGLSKFDLYKKSDG